MSRFPLRKRFYKTYVVLPLLIYSWMIYFMLGNSCRYENNSNSDDVKLHSLNDPKARKIMQIFSNRSDDLFKFVQSFNTKGQYQIDVDKINVTVDNIAKIERRLPLNIYRQTIKSQNEDGYFRFNTTRPVYLINCSNIHEVHLISKIGHGVSKQTFKADFRGMKVAVKMVTRHQREVKTCIEKINENHANKDELRSKCFVFPSMKLMKEILLLEQISHPGFARLLGYCVRNEESETTDLTERGIVSVFELGERIAFYNIQTLTWQQRLKLSTELADFLNYLEHSPLGSLRIRDFKEEHFLVINQSLKMIDLDDVDNLEPACHSYISADSQLDLTKRGGSNGCDNKIACQRGMCIGFNAKQNMKFMNRIFFKKLLYPTVFPGEISGEIGSLLAQIDSDKLTALQLTEKLAELQIVLQ